MLGTIAAILALLFAIFIWFVPSPRILHNSDNSVPTSTSTSVPSSTYIPSNTPIYPAAAVGTPIFIAFRNIGTTTKLVYVVDDHGNEILFATIEPKGYIPTSAHVGDIWHIKDGNGKLIKEITVTTTEYYVQANVTDVIDI